MDWRWGIVALALGSGACDDGNEDQTQRTTALAATPGTPPVRTSELVAGPNTPAPTVRSPYEGDVAAIREGERLFNWYNCAGCHGGAGGGGIGPPLADEEWIYGGDRGNIYQSIVQGRPNGMPAYGGRIAPDEIWRIVEFVYSLSAEVHGAGRAK